MGFVFFFPNKPNRKNQTDPLRYYLWRVYMYSAALYMLSETIKPDIKSISFYLRQEAKTDVLFYIFTVR